MQSNTQATARVLPCQNLSNNLNVMTVDAKELREFDDHEQVIKIEDPSVGLVGFVAIHRKRGDQPSMGATRFWTYESEEEALSDALRLSRLMSYKSAMAGLPYGGAKAVIMRNPMADANKEVLFRSYAKKIDELGGQFVTGSDVGVTKEDLLVMCDNSPYIIGGEVPAGYFTSLGILYSIPVVLESLYGLEKVAGRSFAIQGLGKTGRALLLHLIDRGAGRIVVTDIDESIIEDVKKRFPDVEVVAPEDIHRQQVDVFCPCALSHVINDVTIKELGCRAIVGAANNQLQNENLSQELQSLGILYAPDYIVNAGGMLSVVDEYQYGEHSEERVTKRLLKIQDSLRNIFSKSKEMNISTTAVSDKLAEKIFSSDDGESLVKKYYKDAPALLRELKDRPEDHWIRRGEVQALRLFQNMASRVPAYKDFLKQNSIRPETIKTIQDFESLPLTNKENYLQHYPIESLAWDGVFKENSWMISSTSGSTGEPFYFTRTQYQDRQFALTAELCLREYFGIHKKTTLFIDCFALGVWIGGIFMYQAIKYIADSGQYSLSTITPGADKVEAIRAIKGLAKHFDQIIIGGYGPLVKDLIDEGVAEGIDWGDHDVKYFFAAEGFTEGFRDYIIKHGGARNIYTDTINHYGTADFGTMSHETSLTTLLRRSALEQQNFYKDLFREAHKLPTLTQFIPELFFFEEVGGQLACSGLGGLPLVRYDLKDRGGVFTFDEMLQVSTRHNIDIFGKAREHGIGQTIWNLPFVYLYERSDFTASIYSVNIYPESIRKALEDDSVQGGLTGKFTMVVECDEKQNQYLEIHIELKASVEETEVMGQKTLDSILSWLHKENSEWRDFYADEGIKHKVTPRLRFWPHQDPTYFKSGGKQKWVKK